MKRFTLSLFFAVVLIVTSGLFLSVGGLAWAIPGAQYVCQDFEADTDSTTFVPIDVGFFVTVNNGFFKRYCIVTLSVEAGVSQDDSVLVEYSIDDGPTQPIGPTFFAFNSIGTATTGVGVIQLGKGTHKIQPYFRVEGTDALAEFFNRCLVVECRTQ